VSGTPFWWSWGPEGHPMDTLRPRCPFLSIFFWIWGASRDQICVHFLDFMWSGMTERKTVSRSMILVAEGWKLCSNAMAACAITTVKTMCFEWFHFFDLFSSLVSQGVVLGYIWDSFRWPWRSFLWFWKVLGAGRKSDDFLGIPWGPQIQRTLGGRVTGISRGAH